MKLETALQYITANKFFPAYCPGVMNWKHKMRGKNGKGNLVSFTDADQVLIQTGLENLTSELRGAGVPVKK